MTSTPESIADATEAVKADMLKVFNLYLLRLPHMNVDTNWGDQIVNLTIDLAREIDTIGDQVKAIAIEQADYYENHHPAVLERRLHEAVAAADSGQADLS